MTFTQTSQKFGQWSDVRANTVYGLGFSSEAELAKFVEKFQEVKEATKSALAKTTANGSSVNTPITSANTSPVISKGTLGPNDPNEITATEPKIDPPTSHTQQLSSSTIKMESPSHKNVVAINNANDIKPPPQMVQQQQIQQPPPILPPQNNNPVDANLSAEQQLKYENERLKVALAQRYRFYNFFLLLEFKYFFLAQQMPKNGKSSLLLLKLIICV